MIAADESTRRERKKDATRQLIVEQAMKLFEQQGYDATTMEQIAAAADVAKGTLYNYFPVKEAIVAAYMRLISAQAGPQVEQLLAATSSTRECLHLLFQHVGQWQLPQRAMLERYLSYRLPQMLESLRNPELRSGFDQTLQKVIRRGIENGELNGSQSVEELTALLQSAYLMVMLSWLAHEGYDYPAGLVRMIDLFLDGAAVRTG